MTGMLKSAIIPLCSLRHHFNSLRCLPRVQPMKRKYGSMLHDLRLWSALPMGCLGIVQMLKQLNSRDSNLHSQQKQARQSYIPASVSFQIWLLLCKIISSSLRLAYSESRYTLRTREQNVGLVVHFLKFKTCINMFQASFSNIKLILHHFYFMKF